MKYSLQVVVKPEVVLPRRDTKLHLTKHICWVLVCPSLLVRFDSLRNCSIINLWDRLKTSFPLECYRL